jgi:hypothetical protein
MMRVPGSRISISEIALLCAAGQTITIWTMQDRGCGIRRLDPQKGGTACSRGCFVSFIALHQASNLRR